MTHKVKYISIGAIMASVFVLAFGIFYTVKANPSFFIQNPSATATTTTAFITPGAATSTTAAFDLGVGGAQGADSATLLACYQASSTASVINIGTEYSQDNLTWFANNYASSTGAWTFASSTVGGAGGDKNPFYACKSFNVPTPTRYVRAVFSATTGNAAVWSNFVAKRQSN